MHRFHQNAIHWIVRCAVAFVWLYHGIVPKLIFDHPTEHETLINAGVPVESAPAFVFWIGIAEVVVGLCVLLGLPTVRLPLLGTALFGVVALIGVTIQSPHFLIAAFNPAGLNIQLVALCVIGILSCRES